MSLIDDKGKVLGKINIIDLAIIIIFLSVIPLIIKVSMIVPEQGILENKVRLKVQAEEKARVNKEMEDAKRGTEAWCVGYKDGYADGVRK